MAADSPDDSLAAAEPAGLPAATLLALRARAEQRRHLVTRAVERHSPAEARRLVQELQVHQIELEMQYEELQLAQAEAQAARAQYVDLYDFAPVGYFTLTPTGVVAQLNLRGGEQLGSVRQRLLGRRFALFVAPAERLEFSQFLARVFAADTALSTELTLVGESGTPFIAQLEGLRADAPTGPQCRLAVFDVSARRRATDALAASEARFRKLFTDSNDAVVLLQGLAVVDCNDAALRLLGARGRAAIVGRPASANAPEYQPDGRRTADLFRETVDEALHTGSKRCEAVLLKASGEPIWVEALLTPIEVGAGEPLVHIVWRDVTRRREAQAALQREKNFTDSLLENSVDGLIAIDRDQRVTAWNAEATRYFGPPAGAVLGRPLVEALPNLAGEVDQALVGRVLAGERLTRTAQPFPTRAGHFDAHGVPLRDAADGTPSGALFVVRDVTERDRLAEEATQQRLRRQQAVLAAILSTQETERKRIAEALHNGLGQLLYAAKLSLSGAAAGPATSGSPAALRLLEEAIRTTRTISFELTPGVLEDFGLATALEELIKRIAPAGLPVRLHVAGLEERLPPAVEIAVYRIVQELLNNVMKHAQAREAVVHVARDGGQLEVSVEDDGRGFEPAALASQPLAGIGLAGARNRVALLGGELAVRSQPGRGTVVGFQLCLSGEAPSAQETSAQEN